MPRDFNDLLQTAARLGMPAIAITDHGNLFGAFDFWKHGQNAGINPIIGLEGYYAPQGRRERSPSTLGRLRRGQVRIRLRRTGASTTRI